MRNGAYETTYDTVPNVELMEVDHVNYRMLCTTYFAIILFKLKLCVCVWELDTASLDTGLDVHALCGNP